MRINKCKWWEGRAVADGEDHFRPSVPGSEKRFST